LGGGVVKVGVPCVGPPPLYSQALSEVEELRGGRSQSVTSEGGAQQSASRDGSSASTHFTLVSEVSGHGGVGTTVGRRRTTGGGAHPLCSDGLDACGAVVGQAHALGERTWCIGTSQQYIHGVCSAAVGRPRALPIIHNATAALRMAPCCFVGHLLSPCSQVVWTRWTSRWSSPPR
jgi:hypothetical protein